MIYKLLEIIFRVSEVRSEKRKQEQKDILREKFKMLSNLARSCKLTIQEILQYCPKRIYSRITELLLVVPTITLELIDSFIGLEFFQNLILPQSYFYLILEGKLDDKSLHKLTQLRTSQGHLLIKETAMKKSLHYLVAKLAYTKKVEKAKKRKQFNEIKAIFGILDSEFNQLYKMIIPAKISGQAQFFESRTLHHITSKLSMGKEYALESLLFSRD